jgi:hypothetical protein
MKSNTLDGLIDKILDVVKEIIKLFLEDEKERKDE